MSDTIEQARTKAIASNGQRTHVDALIAAVRAEAQREAFEAGWDAGHHPCHVNLDEAKAQSFAAYLTRAAQ